MKNNLRVKLFLLLATTRIIAVFSAIDENCIVQLPNGSQLRGNCSHKTHKSFTNIPYGNPPIGKLRFESPQPAAPWQGIRDALSTPIICTQFYQSWKNRTGEEDCLYLNVYVPKLKTQEDALKVIVFFHPGAFQFGGPSNSPLVVMAESKAIWITPAYRLGPIGFLSTGDSRIPGNNGLKDQRLTIAWIHKNIAVFGGDPDKILLLGDSAGGASVEYHMDTGTTHAQAFATMSGSYLNPWAFTEKPEVPARTLGQHFKCSINSKDFKKCLQNVSIDDIWYTTTKKMYKFYGFSVAMFRPTIEPENVTDAFLTIHPKKLIRQGKNKDKRYLASVVTQEGAYMASHLTQYDDSGVEVLEQLNKDWYKQCTAMFFYDEIRSAKQRYKLCKYLLDKYMCGVNFTLDTYKHVELMFGDEYFYNGIIKMVDIRRVNGQKVYLAVADLPTRFNMGNSLSEGRNDLCFGSVHTADAFGILPTKLSVPENPIIPERKTTLRQLIKLLESLLLSSEPNYNGISLPANINDKSPAQALYYADGKYRLDKYLRETVNCKRTDSIKCEE